MIERLRELLGISSDDPEEAYRCVNCGEEFDRPFRECPGCGGPYVAPIDGEGNA